MDTTSHVARLIKAANMPSVIPEDVAEKKLALNNYPINSDSCVSAPDYMYSNDVPSLKPKLKRKRLEWSPDTQSEETRVQQTFPTTLNICGYPYKLIPVVNEVLGKVIGWDEATIKDSLACGYIHFREEAIYINKDISFLRFIKAIIHESLHGIFSESGYDPSEGEVVALTNGLYTLLSEAGFLNIEHFTALQNHFQTQCK